MILNIQHNVLYDYRERRNGQSCRRIRIELVASDILVNDVGQSLGKESPDLRDIEICNEIHDL